MQAKEVQLITIFSQNPTKSAGIFKRLPSTDIYPQDEGICEGIEVSGFYT